MSFEPSIDYECLTEIREILGDGLDELLIEFKNEIPLYIQNIHIHLANNDTESMILHTHSLKSSSGNLGLMKLSELCKSVEHGLITDSTMNVAQLVEEIKIELEFLIGEIGAYVKDEN